MNEQHNRREFLQLAGAAMALGPVHAESKILTRTLGKTGITLPVVSMGVMNADVPGLVRRAYEVGMRHYDTAAFYQAGRNEQMVGSVIKEMGTRDKVVVATKVYLRGNGIPVRSPQAKDAFRKIFEGSLKRLQMDHVDILYYHAIDSAEDAGAEGPLQALAELKKEGKTRFTGISTHRGSVVLPEAVRLGVFDVVLVTLNYTMASDKALLDSIDQAANSGLGVVAMKTQAGGLARPDPKLPKGLPPHSQTALLKWVLHNRSITTAIPGVTTYEQMDQNFTVASNLEYTADEKAFLADKTFAASAQFCRQCGECRADCPLGVDIPTLMRSHMYAMQYANRGMAKATLATIESGRGLSACRSCRECKASCRNQVDIGAKIAGLKTSGLVFQG
ncbi:MAG: aldo/keto reductase [Paludibaculum sp.]